MWVDINCISKNQFYLPSATIIFSKQKNKKQKNIGINEKSYKHLKIYFTRYDRGKSIKMVSLYYHKLRGKIENHEGKKIDG